MRATLKVTQSIAVGVTVYLTWFGISIASPLRCDITTKQSCVSETGCTSIKPSVYNVIDFTAKSYSRCDAAGCDTYDAEITNSGAFTNITVPGRGVFTKLSRDNGGFVEVVSLGLQVLVSFGQCQ